MLFLWKPVLLYAPVEYDYHGYDDVEAIKVTSIEELEEKIGKIPSAEYDLILTQCRDRYVSSGDISSNYKKCYQELNIQ